MRNIDNINQNITWFLASSATNYDMPADVSIASSKPLFEYYDSNKDNVLKKEELEKIKQDLQSLISDNGKCSEKDLQKYLERVAPDKAISIKKLNSFITDILTNYENYILNESDGKIEFFQQGEKGDCWLLSQVNSLSQTSWGQDAIKNSIVKNKETNSYTIKFAGVNFETSITQKEIQNARKSDKYSYGDIDMLLLELAAEKYFSQEIERGHIPNRDYVQNGNFSVGTLTMQYLLTGKAGHSFVLNRDEEEDHKKFIEKICSLDSSYKNDLKNNQDYISNSYDKETMKELLNKISSQKDMALVCCLSSSKAVSFEKLKIKKDLSKFVGHEYTIKSINKDSEGNITNIEIINPFDSETIICKTLEEFLDEIEELTIINKDDLYSDYKIGFKPCIKIE